MIVFGNNLFNRHLESDELVIRIVHKHWFSGVKHLFLPILALGSLTSILFFVPQRPLALTVLVLLLITMIWLIRNFFDYYLDAWIITNTGIIDVAWHGWFHRESSRILYTDIQGVSYEIKGVWQTILQTGTISIEKVSTGSKISMQYVQRPRKIEALVLKMMEEYLHTNNLRDADTIQDILINVIAKEVQRKQLKIESSS